MQRFTQRARRVLSRAQEEAEQKGQTLIGTEHVLLGILHDDGGVANRVMQDLGLQPIRVKKIIDRLGESSGDATRDGTLELAPTTKKVLKLAVDEARIMGHHYIGTEHILLGLVRENEGVAVDILKKLGISPEQIRRHTKRILKEEDPSRQPQPAGALGKKSKGKTPLIDQLATDLTKLAQQDKLDPIIGRQTEVERVIQILARRNKNNPALIGEPGVGKTAIVEGLAQHIIAGDVPELLLEKRVLQLDVGSLVANTMYRGQFEDRLKRVINEMKSIGAIMFIDELHMLVGAGAAGSSVDAANILKPALARGELQVIGATTLDEYRKHIESDAALERRFQPIHVDEPSIDETIAILHGINERYEQHHKLTITDEAIEAAARLAVRYVSDRFLPDKAIDLIDESASRVRMYKNPRELHLRKMSTALNTTRKEHTRAIEEERHSDAHELHEREQDLEEKLDKLRAGWAQAVNPKVTDADIAEVVSMWTGVPVTQITKDESERLLQMENKLRERIIGQEKAIEGIARAVRRVRAGLKDPRRPVGSFIFLGPTGVGKTELTKALAEFLFGSEDVLLQLDMSEFMERHTVSRLVGAPPGYIGYNDAGQLTETIRRRPYSIVVFDEIEKAHPDAHNMLLQIMEEGHLSDARGKKVSFQDALIVMTSNVGADLISRNTFGFQQQGDTERAESEAYDDMRQKLTDELRNVFRPEFLNRVDETVVFRSLSQEDIQQIVGLELDKVRERLKERNLQLKFTDEAKSFLAREGYDPEYGARPLRRVIQQKVEDPLSDMLLASMLDEGDIIMDYDESEQEITLQVEPFPDSPTSEANNTEVEIKPEAIPAG